HAFSFSDGTRKSLIGATPELLARVRDGRLESEALAGSAPRGETAASDARLASELLTSEKNLREHRLVLDSICRRLEDLGVSPEYPDRPDLMVLSNVQHLRTPIQAKLPEGVDFLKVVAELHPTPAVGGSPREAAVPLLRELEGIDRGLYAGVLGWLDHAGQGEAVVPLRSGIVEDRRALLFAGAGIVEGSDPEAERRETDLKLQAMLETLRGA
ncbi:MAG: isochorismate synthase, partial [Opitutales bacterium]